MCIKFVNKGNDDLYYVFGILNCPTHIKILAKVDLSVKGIYLFVLPKQYFRKNYILHQPKQPHTLPLKIFAIYWNTVSGNEFYKSMERKPGDKKKEAGKYG